MGIFSIVVLALSGLLLSYAGLMRVIKPKSSLCLKTYSQNPDLKLEGQTDIFNEMRSAGSQLFLSGIIILIGIFISQVRVWSFVVASVTFVGYAGGRLISLIKDGKANKELMGGLFSEIILGASSVVCLIYTVKSI